MIINTALQNFESQLQECNDGKKDDFFKTTI